ncbi:hypothetical protein [Aquisphaera insulae]|uniref:hypothetical protein n=1 Tax=Aquisphaera insulae TaxID=2712864 RepID=UPI0013E9B643|nr:hypothetical protein [Aquisphaera insulae]
MKGGDTFRLVGVADRHTWVVLSDSEKDPNRILIVSFTSFAVGVGMDESCIVEVDEFSLLTNRSCLYYEDIKELSLANLTSLEGAGKLRRRTPVPTSLLQRIRDGAIRSPDCKSKFKAILLGQGVVS